MYERAVFNMPPAPQKTLWQRYIYLWINYALYEELVTHDLRTREVWKACLQVLPHSQFTFAKVWVYAAHFEVSLRTDEISSV